MRRRLLRPRELARQLRLLARREPDEVEDYLEEHSDEWAAIAEATPGDAADILEAISGEAAGELFTDLGVADAADEVGAVVVGGNHAAGPHVEIHTTVVGVSDAPLTRGGASVGEGIYVTGFPGEAALGLHGLLAGAPNASLSRIGA